MNTARQALTSTFIQNTLPHWFIQATPAMRDALRQDMTLAQAAREDLNQVLQPIQDLPAFARPLLTQALDAEFGPGLDVDRDHFFHARFQRDGLTGRAAPQGSSTHSLLAAALQNFEAAEVGETDRESASAIVRGSPDALAAHASVHPLNVRPGRFIELCRRLDLGGQYQRHLRHVLHPVARPGMAGSLDSKDVKARIIERARLALRVDCHIARLKGTIDEAQYQALLRFDFTAPAAEVCTMQMLGCKLRGALLFKLGEQTRCTVYLPGEPDNAVQSYPSLEDFTQALRTRLRSEEYQRYFDRFIPERSKSTFFKRLHERLAPHVLHSVARGKGFHRQLISVSEVDQNAFLDLEAIEVGGALGDVVYLHHMLQVKDDARVLAVPTDDEDCKTRDQRLAEWLDYGMDGLNIAALFVPGLGETMMLVAGAQLLDETFEGIEAWRHGDMDEALDHLGSVAQNLALMGVLGAAGAAAGAMPAEAAASQPPSFITRSVPARDAAGRVRLTDVGVALRRLHPEFADIDDKAVSRIMAVSGVDEERLAALHIGRLPAPAELVDTAKRFRLSLQAAESSESFEAAYRASEQSSDPLIVLLRRDFPSLTLSAGQSLVAEMSAEQRLALSDTQRIPLDVAGKVRIHLRRNRMSRALEGFFLTPSTVNRDLQRLTLRSLATFPGWPADLVIEIREGSATGPLLDSVGAENAERRRVLVRGDKGFQGSGADSSEKPRSLFSALLQILPEDSRRVMGLNDADTQVRALKRRVFDWVRSQPKWTAEQLGEWTFPTRFSPPQRLPDGRIGYPLSGRGPVPTAGSRTTEQQLLQAMTHLYPESVELPEQVRSMARRARPLEQLLAATRARIAAYDQLHVSLIAWAEADDMSVLLNDGERMARRRVANALGRAWRYSHDTAPRGPRWLTLEHVAIPELPPLPDFYAGITQIELNNVVLDSAAADAFLANFPNVTRLNVQGSLPELPAILPQLQYLEHLSLENMPWPIAQPVMDRLMDIPALTSLSLAGTYLGELTDTSRLRLSALWINNTGLTQWPEWTQSLALNELDISDNHITEIAAEVIENPTDHNRHTVIYAYNNPFTHEALEAYWRNDTGYGHRYQLDYDFPEDIREIHVEGARMETDSDSSDDDGEPHGHRAGSSRRVPEATAQDWLQPGEDVLNARLLAAWERVEQAADAPHLLVLLQRLRETPDFRQFHAELASDVLTVLETAAQDAPLRSQLEVMANDRLFGASQTCQDGARLIFSDIQVAVYSHGSLLGVAEGQRAEALLGVIRQLFRLNEVQAIADAEIARRESLGRPVDHAEVRLAYRIGLADDLGLPGQPYRMAWERLAAVDRGALLDARRHILEAERGPGFLQFAVEDRQWNARLRSEHQGGLDLATASVRERMNALEDHPPIDPDDYHRQGMALIAEREAAEALMLRQLTDLYRAGW
ncbi:NEL-type E3 ubiquitin ligase domain-containing protein [Pseudomonas sp. NPDC078416]|uniref:NEL-type E3 ubiquitin ligase domain-containing protein n=1 Tax=Pseudomonas sp. NPDC078416 TaxID=3390637 RepID=UPI003CFE12CB